MTERNQNTQNSLIRFDCGGENVPSPNDLRLFSAFKRKFRPNWNPFIRLSIINTDRDTKFEKQSISNIHCIAEKVVARGDFTALQYY